MRLLLNRHKVWERRMDLKDISARMKKATQQTQDETPAFDAAESFRLRGKMLGVLLRDARLNADRRIEDCARVVQQTPETYESWEYGDAVPSLPQLELLATYLDVPISHFWGVQTLEAHRPGPSAQRAYVDLRQRMIGALLRQARETQGLTVDALAAATHIDADAIARYELGETPIAMHELTVLAGAVKQNLTYFLETSGRVGEMLASMEAWKHFNQLPEELRQFAANPINIGFIEIALAFSQMESERLKRIAVSMLDITGY
ncbi:MAG TPA: helix-turn-helix transcriptional regulator [Aggregatilineales bacterium]|jgi:transcriptional regulator with XRE-family HTH domain|nr:helix-turn-helix transcriptional regulator [Aggregatilineales bacterium]